MRTLVVPNRLEGASALAFADELLVAGERDEVEVDFSQSRYVSPFAMLVMASAFQKRLLGVRHRVVGAAHCGYLAYMGFFRFSGLDFDTTARSESESATCVPMTRVDLDDIRADAKAHLVVPQSRIEGYAHELARRLLPNQRTHGYKAVQFNLQELLRNVLEHSKAKSLAFCAQYWPGRDQAEIGILDTGIGIAESLRSNPELSIEDEPHAINLALLPGISATRRLGVRQREDDAWANAGFGLYMISQLAQRGGDFIAASGETAVRMTEYSKTTTRIQRLGTALCVRFSTKSEDVDPARFGAIVRAGERVAEELTGVRVTGPVASMMLRTAPED